MLMLKIQIRWLLYVEDKITYNLVLGKHVSLSNLYKLVQRMSQYKKHLTRALITLILVDFTRSDLQKQQPQYSNYYDT